MDTAKLAKAIRDSILADVTDRRGWRQAWDSFDDDIKKQIKKDWLQLVKDEIVRAA